MKKKIFAILMAVMMVVTFMPSMAFAEGDVAKIGEQTYPTLQGAVDAAGTGQIGTEIVLLKSFELAEQIQVNDGKTLTLDLNGKTITASDGFSNPNGGVICVHNGGTLTIDDKFQDKKGKISGGNTVYTAVIMTKNGDDSTKPAKLVVNNGTLEGKTAGIAGNGSRGNTDVTIKGGTIKGIATNDSVGIFNPQAGKLSIQGGTIEGAVGVYVKAGTVSVVAGGTIKGNGNKNNYVYSSNGFNNTGDGFVVENCGYPGGKPSVSISGGTFESTSANAVASYAPAGSEHLPLEKFITGGIFSSEPTSTYIAAGYNAKKGEDNKWKVTENSSYTVTFNANGGTPAPNNQILLSGQKASKPTDPTKTGYKLAGWYSNQQLTGNAWNFDTDTVTANTTLYAKWEAITYTVSFDKNDTAATGTMTNQTMTYDTEATLTTNKFTKEGYVFDKWTTNSNGTGTSYANGASVKNLSSTEGATVTLYAQWKSQTTTGGGGATVDATEDVKVTGDTAKVSLDANDIKNIMKEVDAAKSTTLTINAVSTEKGAQNATTSQLEVPTSFIKTVGGFTSTVENLEVKTNVGTLEFDKDALVSIAEQAEAARGTTLTIEIKKVAQKTGEIDQDYELTVKSNNVAIKDFEGGTETVTVPVPTTLRYENISCMYVDNGKVVEGVKKIAQTTSAFTFQTGHNSLYRLTTAEIAKKQIKPLVNDATVYQKSLTAYKNGKIKISWKIAKGYDVDRYQIWRATKKNGKYKKLKVVTNGALSHINTKNLKKGKKYYYKVRGSVQMDDGTWAYTKWSKVRYAKCKKTR